MSYKSSGRGKCPGAVITLVRLLLIRTALGLAPVSQSRVGPGDPHGWSPPVRHCEWVRSSPPSVACGCSGSISTTDGLWRHPRRPPAHTDLPTAPFGAGDKLGLPIQGSKHGQPSESPRSFQKYRPWDPTAVKAPESWGRHGQQEPVLVETSRWS